MSNQFDAIVIGSGAGGGMAALRLCERGLKVALVEAGPRFEPQRDFILNYPDWETRNNPLMDALLKEQTVDKLHRVTDPSNNRRRSAFRYSRVQGLGGSTLHYQGEAHRFPEHAFDGQTRFGWGVDWPIRYADLAPYYQQVENLLGVAGEAGNPHKTARGTFPTPVHALSKRSQILANAAQQAGMTLLPNSLALPSRSVDGRTPCQHSGGCNFGCVFGAKSSIDQAIIPRAEKTGNLQVLTETKALRLMMDTEGEVGGVVCRQGEVDLPLSARHYILAGGAIETPRLLLHSANPTAENGVGNQHDQVGRYFMETVFAQQQFQFAEQFPAYLGPPLDSRIWDFCKPADSSVTGFVLGAAAYLYPQTGPGSHAVGMPGLGLRHKQQMRASFGRDAFVFGVAEQEPQATNRVVLSDRKDLLGVPKVKVECLYSKRDINTIDLITQKLGNWLAATPAQRVRPASSSQYESSATHVGGTCRMGNDPQHSVVNAYGQVHGITNLSITDASVLPSQGAGDSPSLTIQALALRTTDKIADQLA